jgi:hypothetical protein
MAERFHRHTLARLAQVKEPGLRRGEGRSRRGLGTMTDILLRKAQCVFLVPASFAFAPLCSEASAAPASQFANRWNQAAGKSLLAGSRGRHKDREGLRKRRHGWWSRSTTASRALVRANRHKIEAAPADRGFFSFVCRKSALKAMRITTVIGHDGKIIIGRIVTNQRSCLIAAPPSNRLEGTIKEDTGCPMLLRRTNQ